MQVILCSVHVKLFLGAVRRENICYQYFVFEDALVPRTLLIIGIVAEARRREIRKEKEEKRCVAHLEALVGATGWIHCLLNILVVSSALHLPSESIQNIETNRCSNFNPDLFLVKWSRIQRINLLPIDKIYFRSFVVPSRPLSYNKIAAFILVFCIASLDQRNPITSDLRELINSLVYAGNVCHGDNYGSITIFTKTAAVSWKRSNSS